MPVLTLGVIADQLGLFAAIATLAGGSVVFGGAVLAMPGIESAIAVYSRMATFASARVSEATA